MGAIQSNKQCALCEPVLSCMEIVILHSVAKREMC